MRLHSPRAPVESSLIALLTQMPNPDLPDVSNPKAAGGLQPPAQPAKLYAGGGEGVDHSSVHASHGSGPAFRAVKIRVHQVVHKNQNRDALDDRRPPK